MNNDLIVELITVIDQLKEVLDDVLEELTEMNERNSNQAEHHITIKGRTVIQRERAFLDKLEQAVEKGRNGQQEE